MKRCFLALLVLVAVPATTQAAPQRATAAQAHRTIRARYNPASDGFRRYRITQCRRVTRTVTDCVLELYDPVQGESICQPDPDTGDWVCEMSEPQPPDMRVVVTLRVHRGNVWYSPD